VLPTKVKTRDRREGLTLLHFNWACSLWRKRVHRCCLWKGSGHGCSLWDKGRSVETWCAWVFPVGKKLEDSAAFIFLLLSLILPRIKDMDNMWSCKYFMLWWMAYKSYTIYIYIC